MRKTWNRNGRGNTILKGHRRDGEGRHFLVYTVYDNRTDLPVVVDGDAKTAAAAMGLTLGSFYAAVTKSKTGAVKRWHIVRRFIDSE